MRLLMLIYISWLLNFMTMNVRLLNFMVANLHLHLLEYLFLQFFFPVLDLCASFHVSSANRKAKAIAHTLAALGRSGLCVWFRCLPDPVIPIVPHDLLERNLAT